MLESYQKSSKDKFRYRRCLSCFQLLSENKLKILIFLCNPMWWWVLNGSLPTTGDDTNFDITYKTNKLSISFAPFLDWIITMSYVPRHFRNSPWKANYYGGRTKHLIEHLFYSATNGTSRAQLLHYVENSRDVVVKCVDRIRVRWWHCCATAPVCCTCNSAMKPYWSCSLVMTPLK